MQTFHVPHRQFDHINIDSPLPSSQGFTHLLTMVDQFMRQPEAIPLKQTDTEMCVRALVAHWISHFSMPLDMTSDRGSQFMSNLQTGLTKLLGTQLHHTTAYHPQANGQVEHLPRHLKAALRARLIILNWLDELLNWYTVPLSQFRVTSSQHHKESTIQGPSHHNSATLSASSYPFPPRRP